MSGLYCRWAAALMLFVVALLPLCDSFQGIRAFVKHTHRGCNPLQTTSVDRINVDLGDRSYPIYIGTDLLTADTLPKYIPSKRALIVTNDVVGPLYLSKVRDALASTGIDVADVVLPDGEQHKDMETLQKILDACVDNHLDRSSILVALGGGVIGDMCGFAAAIYQRGVRFVQLPTSLMAMVDSAVGGKTAVNHPRGKNLIGAFHQPIAVLADLDTLDTLPEREFISGLSEVVKYGLLGEPDFLQYIEDNVEAILLRDPAVLKYIVRRSCEIKAAVVAGDEQERAATQTVHSRPRALLNLGHTFGHAIETGFGYGNWLHGEAVAAGTVMAARLSTRLGLLKPESEQRLTQLLQRLRLPVSLQNPHAQQKAVTMAPRIDVERFFTLMKGDKKVDEGKLRLILLKDKEPTINADVLSTEAIFTADYGSDELLRSVIAEFLGPTVEYDLEA